MAMKKGAEAMKGIHGDLYAYLLPIYQSIWILTSFVFLNPHSDINKVDGVMDSVREQIEVANEISGAISNPLNMGIDIDQDELQNELDELEQEQLNDKLMGAERAPVHSPVAKMTHGEQRERESC